jgi:ankyrin repeat protein
VFAAAFNRPEAIRILARYGAKINEKTNLINRVYGELTDRNAPQPQGQVQSQRGQGRGQQPAAPATPAPAAAVPAPPQPGQQQPQQPPPQQGQVQQGQGMGRGNAPRDPTRAGGNPKGQLTPLMYAARQGNLAAVMALVETGAKLDEVSGDRSTALLLASINGEFDVAKYLVERGANVNLASVDGTAPLYGVFNIQWGRKTLHPQPTFKTEKTHYLDLVRLLLDKGADPNARLQKDLWYNGFGFALENTNAAGGTPFWKCASVADVDGMKLLISRGADPKLSNVDNVTPLLAASGAGFHGNDDIVTPLGRMAAVRYLIDDLRADVNAIDGRADAPAQEPEVPATPPPPPPQQGAAQPQQQPPPPQQMMNNFGRGAGFSALHNAAARGDNEMILFLVSRGARIDAVARNGNTIADMANGARQRVQPYPETIALLEALGARINYRCVSC